MSEPLVQISDVDVAFGRGARTAHVLRGVTLDIARGETVGLVGESGSGKSTLAKVLVGLVKPRAGQVRIGDHGVGQGQQPSRSQWRSSVQMIPQDPYSSLNPRMTVGQAIAESIDPLRADLRRHKATVADWLERVQLSADMMWRYPHEFSGGQRQRIAVARALAVRPTFVIADEITSALDVSVQADVLELIAQLRAELGLTMLFISHNLAVVRQVSDRVAVMSRGQLVEVADAEALFRRPVHQYTRELLDSVPGSPTFSIA